MLTNFKPKKQTNTSARVVDGKLILSLPDALTPVVWQMDLAHAKASALEVLHNESMNAYTLTLKTPKGETIEVAAFDERDNAVEGLLAASTALENAQGQIWSHSDAPAGPANDGAPKKKHKTKKPLGPAEKKQRKKPMDDGRPGFGHSVYSVLDLGFGYSARYRGRRAGPSIVRNLNITAEQQRRTGFRR